MSSVHGGFHDRKRDRVSSDGVSRRGGRGDWGLDNIQWARLFDIVSGLLLGREVRWRVAWNDEYPPDRRMFVRNAARLEWDERITSVTLCCWSRSEGRD